MKILTKVRMEPGTPKYLYHYTDSAGIIGILTNKKIWLSNLYFMNDSSELELTKKLFTESIIEQNIITNKDRQSKFLSYINDYFYFRICSFSLCENGDLLNQWQGYSGGVNGYSIGFKTYELKKIETVSHRLYKCIYENKEQKELINQKIAELDIDKINDISEDDIWHFSIDTSVKMISYAPIIKNENFKVEEEWRFIIKEFDEADTNYKFRSSSGILPYYELDITKNIGKLIDHFYIGPCTDKIKTKHGLKELLRKSGYKNPDSMIRISNIPYRGKS